MADATKITLLDGGMGQELTRRAEGPSTRLWSADIIANQPDLVEAGLADYENNGNGPVMTQNGEDTILERLMDCDIDNLDNDPLCVEDDDVAFAFQWDLMIPAYESVTICKVKEISAIPEPLTLFGAMISVAGIGGYIRKRRTA